LVNPKRDHPDTRRSSLEGTGLTPTIITPMLDATVDWRRGNSLDSQDAATKGVADRRLPKELQPFLDRLTEILEPAKEHIEEDEADGKT